MEGIIDGVADTPERRDKYLRTIYTKANDMDRLINELTYYSSIDNNRIPYNFHRINVAEFFADCVEDVGLDLESKNIQLNYSNLAARHPDYRRSGAAQKSHQQYHWQQHQIYGQRERRDRYSPAG